MIRPLIFATALAAEFALPATAGKVPDQPLSPQDAKGWVGKRVYSNDGKELGKVTRLDSSAENKATQLYTDIGSTTCPAKHQVILPATRFSLENDRIVIDMTAAQTSKMPKMNY
ncbi:MAG TPA: PRC-barrel domain-containing protein [Geobacterales bacterium]|nr:PRC-barrel domain-containing protein [Geobacterales bacterium]